MFKKYICSSSNYSTNIHKYKYITLEVLPVNWLCPTLPKHFHHFHFSWSSLFRTNELLKPLPHSKFAPSHRLVWTSAVSSVVKISQQYRSSQDTKDHTPGWSLMSAGTVIKLSLTLVTWKNTNWYTLGRNCLSAQLVRSISLCQVT